jgi:hypothetical protein
MASTDSLAGREPDAMDVVAVLRPRRDVEWSTESVRPSRSRPCVVGSAGVTLYGWPRSRFVPIEQVDRFDVVSIEPDRVLLIAVMFLLRVWPLLGMADQGAVGRVAVLTRDGKEFVVHQTLLPTRGGRLPVGSCALHLNNALLRCRAGAPGASTSG